VRAHATSTEGRVEERARERDARRRRGRERAGDERGGEGTKQRGCRGGTGMRETGRNIIKFNVLVYGPRSRL